MSKMSKTRSTLTGLLQPEPLQLLQQNQGRADSEAGEKEQEGEEGLGPESPGHLRPTF